MILFGTGAAVKMEPGCPGEAKMSLSSPGIGLLPKPLATLLKEGAWEKRGRGLLLVHSQQSPYLYL